MDGTGPLTAPDDLYTPLGTASAPMPIDLRRQFAFKAGGHLIIAASRSPPEPLDAACNTIAARVERLMDTSPTFEWLAASGRTPLIAPTISNFPRND